MDDVDAGGVRGEHRYERLTWPEINEAVRQRKVVVLPVGSVEQHGHHLPLDVDVRLAGSVCAAAGAASPEDMLVLPPVSYGYCHHVMDFPGTITVQPTTFVNLLLDITRSVAYHGFKRIVIVNGHGSNHPLVEQAGRQTNLQTDALCCTLSWWQLVADYWNERCGSRARAAAPTPASWRPRSTSTWTRAACGPTASAAAMPDLRDRHPRRRRSGRWST